MPLGVQIICEEVQVNTGVAAVFCENVGELRGALNGAVFINSDSDVPGADDSLCNADFDRTAPAASMKARVAGTGEGFPFPELILAPALTPINRRQVIVTRQESDIPLRVEWR